ncbi:MAG: hypothetical protein LUQ49_01995 [Methanomicrobiales archaeon]|nr:hypothetical protein [Methanomicrobiales archaeon]
MQFTPWHRYLYRMVVGSVLILWGIVELLLLPSGDSIIPTILLAAGLAFLIAGVTRWRKFGNTPEQDERSKKIGAWGLSYSWILSLFFMTVLFMLDELGVLVLTVQAALGASVAVMTLSAVAFQMYLQRMGDVA